MPYEIIVTADYSGDPDQIFARASQLSELEEAMKGIATYRGLPDTPIERGQTLQVDVTLFGFVTTKGHVMHIETLDFENRIIQSREHNPQVKKWDHTLSVQPGPSGTIWRDRVIIDAGWQGAFTARFARYVYRRRHQHREALKIQTSLRRL